MGFFMKKYLLQGHLATSSLNLGLGVVSNILLGTLKQS
jgi:hypothetical protein